MKKLLFILASLMLTNFFVIAQDTMYVMKKGSIIASFATNDIDSVIFYKPTWGKINFTGYAQKGPFINGSSVTVYDLQSDLSQTGKSFNSQITDNKGSFSVDNISLSSNFINLRVDGFYFNEVTGQESASQITLNALSDISGKNNININLLTQLEKARVEYLIKNGKSFSDSKIQAQKEILAIFNIQKSDLISSENLNITKNGDNNAILLAISLIIQGYRSESEMTALLSNISLDIKTDGVLNSSSIGTDLINHAKLFNLSAIRQNIQTRWNTLGITDTISNFEYYIHQFIDNTNYTFTNYITYPSTDVYGINVLNSTDSIFSPGTYLSLSALLPKGTTLKIKHDGNLVGDLGYVIGTLDGWYDLGSDTSYVWRTFGSNRTGLIKIKVFFTGDCTLYFYENGATTPTRIKHLYKK